MSAVTLSLSFSIIRGKPATAGQFRRLEIEDEVALALDQDRHRHRLKTPRVLEGLEFVELEDATQSAALASGFQSPAMKVPTVPSEQLQTVSDDLATASEDSRRLAMRDFGNEGADQVVDELRLLEAVVDAESLRREGATAFEAEESLDAAAIASA